MCLFMFIGDCLLESNSDIKTGENFYFVDNLNDSNEFGRDFFTQFNQIVQGVSVSTHNENNFFELTDVTNNDNELNE